MSNQINIEEVKARLKQLRKNENRTSNMWKPKQDTQTRIRLVPYKHGNGFPFIEAYFHYGIGGKNYVSPITFGEPDPFVEFSEQLKSTGDKEDWLLSRKFDPKMRTYAPIIVRGQETQGVKFWGFGKMVYQELLGFIADPDWGDISDPQTGKDFLLKYDAPVTGQSYPITTIVMKPKELPLTEDSELLTRLLNEQPTIEELFEPASYDTLKKVLENWLQDDGDDDGDDDSEEAASEEMTETELESETAKVSRSTTKFNIDDVSSAFDDVFNDD